MAVLGDWRLQKEHGTGYQATALLRDVPVRNPSSGISSKHAGRADGTWTLDPCCASFTSDLTGHAQAAPAAALLVDLTAFPELTGESLAFRKQRLAAYREVWANIKSDVEGVLHQSNEVVFNSLLAFVCQAHAAALTTKGSCATGYLNDEEVPLGLVFAGGINSTDHRDTFERLAVFLRQQPIHGQKFKGATAAVQSILQQFMQLPEGVHCGADVDALLEELHCLAATGSDNLASRPLVVILEELDAWDAVCLSDVVVLLKSTLLELPVVLLAHVSTSTSTLQTVLNTDVVSHIRPEVFRLPSSLERMELILCKVFLSGRHSLFLHHNIASAMDAYFQCHDFTAASFMRCLQLALVEHFMSEPLSMLMQPCMGGESSLQHAVDEIKESSPELLAYGRLEICPNLDHHASESQVTKGIVEAVLEARKAQIGWAVVLRWIACTARVLASNKDPTFRSGFGVKDLFRLGCFPSYFGHEGKGWSSISKMTMSIASMKDQEVLQLLNAFIQEAEEVRNSEIFLSDIIQNVVDIMRKADGKGGSGEHAIENHKCILSKQPKQIQHGQSLKNLAPGRSRKALAAVVSATCHASVRNEDTWDNGQQGLAPQAASFFVRAVERFLTKHPASLNGSAVFHCKANLEGMGALQGSPRHTMHLAMHPHDYLPAGLQQHSQPTSCAYSFHDTATAYQLSMVQGEFMNLGDWFSAFSADVVFHSNNDGRVATTDEYMNHSHGKPLHLRGHRRQGNVGTKRSRKHANELVEEEQNLAARFTQALSELQLAGLLKSAKRNRQEAAQRLIFPYVFE